MSADLLTTTFSLKEPAEHSRRGRTQQRAIVWGFVLAFCIPGVLFVVLPTHLPLWYRGVVGALFPLVGVMAILLARFTYPRLMEPKWIPLNLTISPTGIEVRFEDGRLVSHDWDEPSLRLIFLQVKHPTSHRDLRSNSVAFYINDQSVYQAIRLEWTVFDALTQAATQHQFAKNVRVWVGRYPARELVWTVYTRSGPT